MASRVFKTLFGCVVLITTGTLSAHHNMSALFDFSQRFTRTGTLTKSDWRNPHIYLSVDAKSDKGQVETWLFEGPAPTVFRNLKVGKSDFENAIGKTVKVEASRARDGSLKVLCGSSPCRKGKVSRYVRKIVET